MLLHRAVLYITHGVGEYGGRYEQLGVYLRDNNIAVHTQDFGQCICNAARIQVYSIFDY